VFGMTIIIACISICVITFCSILWIAQSNNISLIKLNQIQKEKEKLEYIVLKLAGNKIEQEAENSRLEQEHIIQL
jgi:beta-lactam-binding protein with PASTA domain